MTELGKVLWRFRVTRLEKSLCKIAARARFEGVPFCWAFADQCREVVGRWHERLEQEKASISPLDEPAGVAKGKDDRKTSGGSLPVGGLRGGR